MPDFQPQPSSVQLEYGEKVEEHDRLYQKYSLSHGIYHIPIDEDEEERLVLQHDILHKKFDGKLFFFPKSGHPDKVLDCGYGQGSWVLEVAERYPDCKVTAIDIYPADLPDVPDNLTLECADLNQSLVTGDDINSYDVIQSRFVGPGIHKNRWPSYIADLAKLLKPGGGLQVFEYYYNIQSDSGALNESHALYQWGVKYRKAMEEDRDPRIGTTMRSGIRLVQLLERAGLVNIQYQAISLPIGTWPRDPKERQIGEMNLQNINRLLDSFSLWPFITRLGMDKDEVLALNNRARSEANDATLRPYIPLTIAWGMKPAKTPGASG